MCRWMGWLGQPVLIDELLFKTQHGIVDQSLHSRMGAETTNGDGFGMGWYGAGDGPGVYHSVAPAWGDSNRASLPRTSSLRSSSLTCARRSARRFSRPTATRSATGAGCSCTTATSPSSTGCGGISCSRSSRTCSPTWRLDRHRGRLPSRADPGAGVRSHRRARAHRERGRPAHPRRALRPARSGDGRPERHRVARRRRRRARRPAAGLPARRRRAAAHV